MKSAVVDPPLCNPLVVNVIFKLRFFPDFYAYYDNKRAMLRSLGGGKIKKHIKTTAANLKALKTTIIINNNNK